MDEFSESLSVPPWIWVALVMVVSAALGLIISKFRGADGSRDSSSSRRRRHRHRSGHGHRSSSRHRSRRHGGDH
ncbi:MAG TPA: hypothetical protein VGE76_11480 [Opitutaceae bacterium]